MARTLSSVFKSEKNKKENKPVYLYTIHDYDGNSNNLNLTGYRGDDIMYKDITYTSFPISYEYISENTKGEITGVVVKLSNVSRLIQAYLENYDFRKKKVTIRQAFVNQLNEPDAYIQDVYYIDSYTADSLNVEFKLTSKFDILDVELPFRKFSRNYCSWKFKSSECGYSGGETVCNKTLTRCRQLGNQRRIGSFPAIPSKRIYAGW